MEVPKSFAWAVELLANPAVKSANTVMLYGLLASTSEEAGSTCLQITNKDLAQILNNSEKTIQRQLLELKQAGYISISVSGYERTISLLTPSSVSGGWSSMSTSTPSSVSGGWSSMSTSTPSPMSAPSPMSTSTPSYEQGGSNNYELNAIAGDLSNTAAEFKQYVSELRSCLSLARQMPNAGGNFTSQTRQFQTENSEDQYTGEMPTQQDYQEILGYLNQKTGKGFRVENQNTKYIDGRWKKGYRTDDFKRVIDNKCNDWLRTGKRFSDGALAEDYLRPSTLFSEKNFEKYLNQTPLDEYGFPINSTQPGLSEWDKEIIENERKHGGHIF